VIGRRKCVCYVGKFERIAQSQLLTGERGAVFVLSHENLKTFLVF
jgi:hypothetical protein